MKLQERQKQNSQKSQRLKLFLASGALGHKCILLSRGLGLHTSSRECSVRPRCCHSFTRFQASSEIVDIQVEFGSHLTFAGLELCKDAGEEPAAFNKIQSLMLARLTSKPGSVAEILIASSGNSS